MNSVQLTLIACAGYVALVALLAALLTIPAIAIAIFAVALGLVLIIPLLGTRSGPPRADHALAPAINVYSHISTRTHAEIEPAPAPNRRRTSE